MATRQYRVGCDAAEGNSEAASEASVLSASAVRAASVARASPRAWNSPRNASRPASQAARRESSGGALVTAEKNHSARPSQQTTGGRGRNSQRVLAAFLVADADGLVDFRQKDFTVADFACARGFQDGLHDGFHQAV